MKEKIEKYFEGRTSLKEQQNLLAYLRESEQNPGSFEQVKEEWKNDQNKLVSLHTWNAWKKLEKEVNPGFFLSRRSLLSVVSIASVIIVIFGLTIIQSTSQSLSLQTQTGQLIEVYLPDSSKVFINSDSKVSYNTKWFGLKREVKLEGEAYFEVAHEIFSSFDVLANDVRVKVTGTKFNVEAYEHEVVTVVLEEGSVQIAIDSEPGFEQSLKPGELIAINSQSKQFVKQEAKVKDYTSWIGGGLFFRDNKLPDLLKSIERRYGVSFKEIEDPVLKEFTLTLAIRDERFEKVMEIMMAALPIKVHTHNELIEIELDETRYNQVKPK